MWIILSVLHIPNFSIKKISTYPKNLRSRISLYPEFLHISSLSTSRMFPHQKFLHVTKLSPRTMLIASATNIRCALWLKKYHQRQPYVGSQMTKTIVWLIGCHILAHFVTFWLQTTALLVVTVLQVGDHHHKLQLNNRFPASASWSWLWWMICNLLKLFLLSINAFGDPAFIPDDKR